MVQHQVPAEISVNRGRELEHDAQVVGQLSVVEHEPGLQVSLFETQQCHTSLPGVAVGEVRQEQIATPTVVERLDVVGLDVRQWRRLEVRQEVPDRVSNRDRQRPGG